MLLWSNSSFFQLDLKWLYQILSITDKNDFTSSLASASCAFSSHMAAYCNRTCGVHGHHVDQIKIVIENYLFSQPLRLSFIPQATASTRVQLREKVKLFKASPKLRGTPRPIFKPKIVHKALQKEKDIVWPYKEVIKPQSCQSFCVFRWVPAAYSTFVSPSLFFFWKLLILDLKKNVFKNYYYFPLVNT